MVSVISAPLLMAAAPATGTPDFPVRDIAPFASSSHPANLVEIGGTLYFSATDPEHGRELWCSDGTADGTRLVADLLPGPASADPSQLIAWDGRLAFVAHDGSFVGSLWRSDGTVVGTVNVSSANPTRGWTSPALLTSVGPALFFSIWPRSVWRTDGSDAGTARLPIPDPEPYVLGGGVSALFAAADLQLIAMAEYLECCEHNSLLRVDAHGVRSVFGSSGAHPTAGDLAPEHITALPTRLLFAAESAVWSVDRLAADADAEEIFRFLPGSRSPYSMTAAGAAVFFGGVTQERTRGLWRTSGAAADVTLVAPFPAVPCEITALGNSVLFSIDDRPAGSELWRSDGTAAGTVRLHRSAAEAWTTHLVAIDSSRLVFSVINLFGPSELWLTDGSVRGTRHVATLGGGAANVYPESFTVSGQHLFYTIDTAALGRELWAIPLSELRIAARIPCAGDCSGDGIVSINELIAGVALALGDLTSQTCLKAFCSSDCGPGPGIQPPDIACLTRALGGALDGCPVDTCANDGDCDDGNLGTNDECTPDGCRNECLLVSPGG